jgi:hypothetical protein
MCPELVGVVSARSSPRCFRSLSNAAGVMPNRSAASVRESRVAAAISLRSSSVNSRRR